MTGKPRPTEPVALPVRWRKIYCTECKRYLLTAMVGSVVEIKCPKCKAAGIYEAA